MRVALYVLTLFGSAALVFAVQPLVGKALLPRLGGVPGAWTACLLFFQGALLGGYVYVWAIAKVPRRALGVAIHAVVVLGALALWPLSSLHADLGLSATREPTAYALAYLTLNLGPAFVALSATAPLLSLWFGWVEGRRPYFLYAASNAGSLLALLGYPFLIEPWLDLEAQASAFRVAMAFVVGGVLAAGMGVLRRVSAGAAAEPDAGVAAGTGSGTGAGAGMGTGNRSRALALERFGWLVLSFVPAMLLAGSSATLSLDVAPLPLLWVVPLALYIGSFVLAFSEDVFEPPPWLGRALCLVAVVLIYVSLTHANEPLALLMTLHLAFLGGASWLAHRRLARSAPELRRLPEFYALVALGGVLGTLVSVEIAPRLLNDLLEYPAAIALACALRPRAGVVRPDRDLGRDLLHASVVAVLVAAGALVAPALGLDEPQLAAVVMLAPAALYSYRWMPLRRRYTGCLLALLVAAAVLVPAGDRVLGARSFFGVVRVLERDGSRYLLHGTTLHGEQRLDERDECTPRPYYVEDGPAGRIFAAHRARGREGRTVVIGLGTGALVCYARPTEPWRFLEIDPLVGRIANDPTLFTYLHHAPSERVAIDFEDGRLGVEQEEDGSLALLVVDAFSSDSVPVHLLTVEALQLYMDKLAPGGWAVLHLSNRALDLPQVVSNGVARAGLVGRFVTDEVAHYVVVARGEEDLGELSRARRLPESRPDEAWTDRFSSLLSAIRFGRGSGPTLPTR